MRATGPCFIPDFNTIDKDTGISHIHEQLFAAECRKGTLFSALTAVSADIAHLIKSVMSLLFWITPVLWSVGRLSGALKLIVLANPITYIVGGYRDALVTHRWVTASLPYTAYFWGVVAILVPLASYVYAKLAPEFADVL